jgi:hypothetical protein
MKSNLSLFRDWLMKTEWESWTGGFSFVRSTSLEPPESPLAHGSQLLSRNPHELTGERKPPGVLLPCWVLVGSETQNLGEPAQISFYLLKPSSLFR